LLTEVSTVLVYGVYTHLMAADRKALRDQICSFGPHNASTKSLALSGMLGVRMIGGDGGDFYIKSAYGSSQEFPLTKLEAEDLIVVLQHFVRTGNLGVDTYEDLKVGTVLRGTGPENVGKLVRITGVSDATFYAEDIHYPGPDHAWCCMLESLDCIWVVENQPLPDPPKTWHERIMEDED
jgi:hypothetical protein